MIKKIIIAAVFLIITIGYFCIFKESEKKKIVVTCFGSDIKIMERLSSEYMKENKDVEIEIEDAKYFNYIFVIDEKLRSNQKIPDIFLLVNDQILTLIEKDVISSINKKELEESFELAKKSVFYNGKYYGYPFYSEALFIFYNKKIVKNPPITVEELVSTAENIKKEKNITGLTFSTTEFYYHYPWYTYFGGSAEDLTEFNEKSMKIMENELKFSAKQFEYSDFNLSTSLFKNETAAMIIAGNWLIPYLKDSGIDYGITNVNQKNFRVFSGFKTLSVSKKAENKREVEKFLKYVTSYEVQKKLSKEENFITINSKLIREKRNKITECYFKNMGNMDIMPLSKKLYPFWIKSNKVLNEVFKERVEPEKAIGEGFKNE